MTPLENAARSGPAVVALGGGHGLAASLRALRHLTDQLTAVVTVADDGGSSGRLRRDFGVVPPGDLRMALAALCADGSWGTTWRDVLQHRFSGPGDLQHHSVGNLLIVALWELLGDTVEGLEWVGRLLGAQGRVLPMSTVPLEIEAGVCGTDLDDLTREVVIRGQVSVARTPGQVRWVRLVPNAPPACVQAVEAIKAADWVILGPGSWFTSVMPHVLVPQLRDALSQTPARRMITLNLLLDNETGGFDGPGLLAALHEHAPELRVDVVLADAGMVADEATLARAAQQLGAQLVVAAVADAYQLGVHDPLRLAAAYRDILR
ncbi:MAG: gluconeogenesis factor YvcK family protein [Actinomycetota bacterium]